MSDTDMIRGFVKNILKPIIAEAIAEVGAESAQKSEKRYYTREEACQHLKIGTTTYEYSVLDFLKKLFDTDNQSAVELGKANYRYYVAAQDYFNVN